MPNLKHFDGAPIIGDTTFCKGEGDHTSIIDYRTLLQNKLKICSANNESICSNVARIEVPSHPISFHLSCDVGAKVANEMGESFDCSQPSQSLYYELGSRFSYYVDDLNKIFEKRTIRSFVFNQDTGIVISNTFPLKMYSHTPKPDPAFGFNAVVEIKHSDTGYSHHGSSGVYQDGSIVSWNSYWDNIHDGAELTPHTESFKDYWGQVSTITHEFGHSFGAARGEYYNLSQVQDNTGIEPIESISISEEDNTFWNKYQNYLSDPMYGILYLNKRFEYTHEQMHDSINFADVTVSVINRPITVRNSLNVTSTTDLSLPTTLTIVDKITGKKIQNANVRVWNAKAQNGYGTNSERSLINPITDGEGKVFTNLDMAFGNSDYVKLIKVTANGYKPKAYWHQIYDLQSDFLIHDKSSQEVTIQMESSTKQPWKTVSFDIGGVKQNSYWNYAMGYHFTPEVNGEIVQLGGLFQGSKQVKLFERNTGNLLAEATVTGNYTDYVYSDITPVIANADTEYTVAVYTAGSGASYQVTRGLFPFSSNGITINSSAYKSTRNNANAIPTSSTTSTMYGMADISFIPEQ